MNDARIVVSHLSKQYKEVAAVDDLSFTVEPGRVTGFLGPNGAGKTTTLRMLLNLVMPDDRAGDHRRRRYVDLAEPTRRVGAVLERPPRTRAGPAATTCGCCVPPGCPWHGPTRCSTWSVCLGGDRTFKGYSLGMRQRLGIATALLGDPAVLILDEPANGLDPEGIRWMRDLLQRLAGGGAPSWSPATCSRRCRCSPRMW